MLGPQFLSLGHLPIGQESRLQLSRPRSSGWYRVELSVFPEESPNAFLVWLEGPPRTFMCIVHHLLTFAVLSLTVVCLCVLKLKIEDGTENFVTIRGSFPHYGLPKIHLLAELKLVPPSLYNWWGASNLRNVFISFIHLKSTRLQWFQLYLQRYLDYSLLYL